MIEDAIVARELLKETLGGKLLITFSYSVYPDGSKVFDWVLCVTEDYDYDLLVEAVESWIEDRSGEAVGIYTFDALASYSEAQIGNYPPPNVEAPEYYDIGEHKQVGYCERVENFAIESDGGGDDDLPW